MSRGKKKNSENLLIALWIPRALIVALDKGVQKTDSDRSKFIRSALREKLARESINSLESG